MSRIEIAMEKAARLKQAGACVRVAPLPPAGATLLSGRYGRLCPSNPYLVNLHDPQSPPAEEYRKLKSALVALTKGDGGFRNSLLVTSSLPSEGKSLTAMNLGITLAQELDHTVLLIDADLRRPALHRYFEIEQGRGLADVLLGEARIEETLISTGIGKLSIMRAGTSIDNPAELLSSGKMKGVVEELKRRYPDRYLIFDSSPLIPFAEARSLAHLVDGVLFVVMERLASQSNVREAVDALKGCRLLGLVYNAALVGIRDHRYYHSYDQKKRPGNGEV